MINYLLPNFEWRFVGYLSFGINVFGLTFNSVSVIQVNEKKDDNGIGNVHELSSESFSA